MKKATTRHRMPSAGKPSQPRTLKMAGMDMTHVPYKGSAAAYSDLLGGTVKTQIDVLPSKSSSPPA